MRKFDDSISVKLTETQIEIMEASCEINSLTKTEFIRNRIIATPQYVVKLNDVAPLVYELSEVIEKNKAYMGNKSIARQLEKINKLLLVANTKKCNDSDNYNYVKINIPLTSEQKEKLTLKAEKKNMNISVQH